MRELKIETRQIGEEAINAVSARDLHGFLEVGKDFTNWIKDRIDQYGFTENKDFVCSPELASKGRGGHNRVEYHVSLDMAKELSMVERNAKGKEARQYFLECERRAKQPADPMLALDDPRVLLDALKRYGEKVLSLEEKVGELTPKR